MKVLKKQIQEDAEGTVVLIPEESEDLWHIYNIVAKGDIIKAATYRKVEKAVGNWGTVSKERKKIFMTLQVTKNAEYDSEGDEIRFAGVNHEENEYVSMGANHTITLELNSISKIEIYKDQWDMMYRTTLDEAINVHKSSEVCCILMDQSQGLVQFFFLTNVLAKVVFRLQVTLPKNRKFEKANFDKAMTKFYDKIIDGIKNNIDFNQIKCVVVAGPGFLKSEFMKYLKLEASNTSGGGSGSSGQQGAGKQNSKEKPNKANKTGQSQQQSGGSSSSNWPVPLTTSLVNTCFFEAQCATANKQGLQELLSDENVTKRIAQTKAFQQQKLLDELYRRLQMEPDRACYGPGQVQKALDLGAVDTLMVTDQLFRAKSLVERKKYVTMVETCRDLTGKQDSVAVFSSQHVTGEKLKIMSGIAALLRFPVEDLDDIDSSDDEAVSESESEAEKAKDGDDDDPFA